MSVDAIVAIRLRNFFYYKGQRNALKILLISMINNGILLFCLWYLIMHPLAPEYFPISINGRILEILSLNQPNHSDDVILHWTSYSAIAAFSYNYVNYRGEFQASSGFFTPDGWNLFLKALKQSNNLDAITNKKFVVSAQLISNNLPSIQQKGVMDGKYYWKILVPILVTYQNNILYTQQYNLVHILVERVPTLNAPYGIGISQFVVTPM